jgi:ketosteroid isomerase-like protein
VDDRYAIIELTSRFAQAVDEHDWGAVASVFTPDVVIDYSTGAHIEGPDAMVGVIRRVLDHAGPSQHLVGNFILDVDSERARASCYVRAFIAGAPEGPVADGAYENFAVYHDELVRTEGGWRVARRRADIVHERGDRRVLGP